ncbi:hypothetical protein FXW78_25615 [Rhodococcus opacus]|nr:hypothetical protein [Rhodococcus opacus]
MSTPSASTRIPIHTHPDLVSTPTRTSSPCASGDDRAADRGNLQLPHRPQVAGVGVASGGERIVEGDHRPAPVRSDT